MAIGNWTPEETKMAFALYMLLESREIDKHNENVVNLAVCLTRTPNAVSLKLANIAAHDMNRVEAARMGMRHSSKLDKAIWTECSSRSDDLLIESLQLLTDATKDGQQPCPTYESIVLEFNSIPEGKERTTQVQ